jgi:eukaryotic-like serine/threonine-protein kinase
MVYDSSLFDFILNSFTRKIFCLFVLKVLLFTHELLWQGFFVGLINEGQVIRGTWEVERFLGEGAFAEVYRVKHRFLGRQAMKVFKSVDMDISEIEEMLGEAMILSRMGHPNIVRVFDANTTETQKGVCGFFTMEYVAGGSVEDFWRSYGAGLVPVDTVVEILMQICRGLSVAHSEKPPIIHRDIKPQNILVGYDGTGLRVRVTDFGLAKRVNPLTLLATTKGTLPFKAPEALKDIKTDSLAGDVWAMGATLYLLLTDQLPYPGLQDPDCFNLPLIPPSRFNVQVDPLLDRITLKALSINKETRYQNALELLNDLKKWRPKTSSDKTGSKGGDSYNTKTTLGVHAPPNEGEARKMIKEAIKLSRNACNLQEAADLMEEAFNKWPDLRVQYESQLSLWRKGIVM